MIHPDRQAAALAQEKRQFRFLVICGAAVVVVLLIYFLLIGSGGPRIGGKWNTLEGLTIEFHTDGTVESNGYEVFALSGKYTLENRKLSIIDDETGFAETYEVTQLGDAIQLTQDGLSIRLIR